MAYRRAKAPLRLIQALSEKISAKLALYPDVAEHPIYSLATELDVEFRTRPAKATWIEARTPVACVTARSASALKSW